MDKARLDAYIRDLFSEEDEILRQVRQRIEEHGMPTISVNPEEARFLRFLVQIQNARLVLEIGTLGGYSAIAMARALGPGGKILTLEKSAKHASVARQNFELAGVADKVELLIGDAHQVLPRLVARGPFDLAFVDAEKQGYPVYLDWCLDNVRPGGVIAFHNALRKGSVFDAHAADAYTEIMQRFNRRFAREERLLSILSPLGDGTLVGIKLQ